MDLGADTEGETPSTSSAPSNLATKLLSLWAHGKLSAVEVQKLSNLATLDGCSHPEVATLGAAGNFGEQPGNCHRALVRSFCNQLSVPEPGLVTCKCFDPKTSKIIGEDVAIFYPHLMFSALAESYPEVFQRLFKLHELPEFWEQTLARDDDRLVNHPATLEKGWEQVTIPLFTHGDGVEYESRDSLMVWSFGPLLSQEQSLDSHLLMAAWPKSCTCKDTWPQLWKELAWSFKALAKGQHPTHDADGNPLKKGSPFWVKKGKPLAPGLKAIVWCIEGDHEFFSNSLGLPHWRNASPCWNCDCTQAAGEKPYNKLHPWDQFTEVDHSWAQAFPSSEHPLLTEVPGNSSRLLRGDALHILFTKGLYGHLLGSILHYLCWYDEGAHQATKPADRLGIIFKEVQAVYTDKEVTCRLTNLVLSMFTDPKKPWANWANLSCKGGEGKHLAPCLLEVLKNILDFSKPEHSHMLKCLEHVCQAVAIWDSAGTFLTKAEFKKSWQLAQDAMKEYQWLNAWSEDCGRSSFHIVIKHHTFLHLAKDAWYLNPRVFWCFKAEDCVGHISTVTHSVSMGVKATKISQKLAIKYRILLHLLYTRPGFHLQTEVE